VRDVAGTELGTNDSVGELVTADPSAWRFRQGLPVGSVAPQGSTATGMPAMIRFGVQAPKTALVAWACRDPLCAAAFPVPVEPGGQIAAEQMR